MTLMHRPASTRMHVFPINHRIYNYSSHHRTHLQSSSKAGQKFWNKIEHKMQAAREKTDVNPQDTGAEKPQPRIRLGDKKVKDLMVDKRRLVEVPYTASLADTMNALMANRVVSVPVAAPPGHWIGAGGSMIVEADKQTGAVRKHYIGMVTMLDILAHIAGNDVDEARSRGDDLDKKMSVPVSSIIGHCLESLSLWTLNPNTSILDCMEVFSKGIHRALVPIDSHIDNTAGVELVESASSYRMLTQMDLLKFLKAHEPHLRGVLSRSVREAGAVTDIIFAVTDSAKVMDVIKCMRTASLTAVPIVESSIATREDHTQLVNGKERKLVGTFSATDLRGCPISYLQSCLKMGVVEFLEKLAENPMHQQATCLRSSVRDNVVCSADSRLGEAVDKAITHSVHRVWVVDGQGLLDGLISLTDMVRVTRVWMLTEPV